MTGDVETVMRSGMLMFRFACVFGFESDGSGDYEE